MPQKRTEGDICKAIKNKPAHKRAKHKAKGIAAAIKALRKHKP